MKNASYNPEDIILRVLWSDAPIQESDEVEPGVILDYDSNGNVLGIEIMNASRKISGINPSEISNSTAKKISV